MSLKINSLVSIFLVSYFIFACGPQGEENIKYDQFKKTIKGFAFKENGTLFGSNAKIYAISASGILSKSAVDNNGEFTLTLLGKNESSKKLRLLSGNTYIKVSDEIDTLYVVIPYETTVININIITFISSQLLINKSGVNLAEIFDEIDFENNSDEISSQLTMESLKKIQEIYYSEFTSSVETVLGTLFGFDSLGNGTVDSAKFLTGNSTEKEITLIKAAAKIKPNLFALTISAVNNPNNSAFLFNDKLFFKAVGEELANKKEMASRNEFSDFLDDVIKSQELKASLKTLASELNSFVLLFENNQNATFDLTIPLLTVPAPKVIVSLVRSEDTLEYTIVGGAKNDTVWASLGIVSDSKLEAVISMKLTFDGVDLLPSSTFIIIIVTIQRDRDL